MSHSFYKGYSREGDIEKNVARAKYMHEWLELRQE